MPTDHVEGPQGYGYGWFVMQTMRGTPLYRYQSPTWPELLHEIIEGEQAIETARAQIEVGEARLAEARARLEVARERLAALERAEFKKVDVAVLAADLEASLPRLEAELQLAETRLANAERTREHALHRASAASGISEEELDAEVPSEEAEGRRVPRYSTVDWIEVRAHEAGVVESLAVTDGAYVEPTTLVLSVVDPTEVRFRALALQADLPDLADGGVARIVPPPTPGLPMDAGVPATMTLGLRAFPDERTITLVATPEASADWIRPGVSAFLEIVVESTASPVYAVPRSAVVRDGLSHVLFRRDPDDPNAALRVEADLGVTDGVWVELRSGVARGDEVVLAGAYELQLATRAVGASPDGGHVHADGSEHADH